MFPVARMAAQRYRVDLRARQRPAGSTRVWPAPTFEQNHLDRTDTKWVRGVRPQERPDVSEALRETRRLRIGAVAEEAEPICEEQSDLVPLFLVALFVTSAVLAFTSLFYAAVTIAQVCFYLAATAAALMVRFGINSRWLALPYYFVITNVACLIALIKFVRGERYVKWEPVRERVANI